MVEIGWKLFKFYQYFKIVKKYFKIVGQNLENRMRMTWLLT